jgi:hypothetical protein
VCTQSASGQASYPGGSVEGTTPDPYAEGVDPGWAGRDKALDLLVELAHRTHLRIFSPGWDVRKDFGDWVPQIYSYSSWWDEVQKEPSLAGWVYAASRDPAIEKLFGKSETVGDQSYEALQHEAVIFVNAVLRSQTEVDPAIVRSLAEGFWDTLTRPESYEIGAHVMVLDGEADPDYIAVGRRAVLHKIHGEWAAERFERAADIPDRQWALSIRVTRRRSAERSSRLHEIDRRDEELLDAAMLALRLVKPSRFWNESVGYWLGLRGELRATRKELYSDWWWSLPPERRRRIAFSRAQMDELSEIGPLISKHVDVDELIGSAPSIGSSLSLALRRFNGAFRRESWHDRIIDQAIALEALLAGSGTETTFKSSLRCATLLATSTDQAKLIFEAVTRFYGLRSAIVHANLSSIAGAVENTVAAWYVPGTLKRVKKESRGPLAAAVGDDLVAQLLRACLRLKEAGEPSPADSDKKPFLDELDFMAFDWQRWKDFKKAAGITWTQSGMSFRDFADSLGLVSYRGPKGAEDDDAPEGPRFGSFVAPSATPLPPAE